MSEDELGQSFTGAARMYYELGKEAAGPRLWRYQRGRCAICGIGGTLVLDHDHETGLIRGYLCRGCNVSEGSGNGHPVFVAYRRNPPAAQLGIREPYVNPITRLPSEPRPHQEWGDPFLGKNAAKEAGL